MATLSGNKIKDTYQSLVKFSDNGNITVGAKQLTDGFGNNSPMFVSTTQVGIGVTPEAGLNLHVFGDAKIGSNLTVIGNLVVEGSTTTVGTDTLTVKDPLIVLANNNTSTDAVDIGFYGKYTPSGTTLYSGLFREALTGKYRLFKGLEDEPTTTVNTSGTGYAKADLVIGDLETTQVDLRDDEKIRLGDNQELEIYHFNNDYSWIKHSGTEALFIQSDELNIRSNVGTENMITALYNGSVDLWYDGSKKLETTSTGISVTGIISNLTDPSAAQDAATKNYVDTQIEENNELSEVLANGNTTGGTDIAVSSGDDVTFTSSSKLIFTGGVGIVNTALEMYHDGTDGYIKNDTGNLIIEQTTDDADIVFKNDNGSGDTIEYFRVDGSESRVVYGRSIHMADNVSIFLGNDDDGLIRYDSTADKILYTGTSQFSNDVNIQQNLTLPTSTAATIGRIKIGNGGEIQLYFDNTDSYLYNISSGDLNILSDQTVFIGNSAANETYAKFIQDGSVELYYNNSKKLQTTNTGVDITGNIDFTGNINIGDNQKILFGDSGDVEMFFNGSTFVIDDTVEVFGFDIDTNLIRFRGTDLYTEISNAQHTFWTNGTERFKINATEVKVSHQLNVTGDLIVDTDTLFVDASEDSVGIGETNPATILHISDGNTSNPSTDAPVIRLENTSVNCSNLYEDGDVIGGLEFYNDSIICSDVAYAAGVNAYVRAVHDGSNSPTPTSSLEFGTGTATTVSTQMTIDSSGNVGIGETSLQSWARLQVAGTAGAQTGANQALYVTAPSTTAGEGVGIRLSAASGSNEAVGIIGMVNNASGNAGSMTFHTYNGGADIPERMRIDSSGIVKIFTTGGTSEKTYSASAGLQLYSQQSDAGSPYTKTSDIVANGDGTVPSELRMFTKASGSSTPTERMRIDSSGLVEIKNTTPTLRLTNTQDPLGDGTVGILEFFTNDSSVGATRTVSSIVCDNQAGSSVPGGDLVFKTSLGGSGSPVATEKLRIKDNGKVGIGTDTPSALLEIQTAGTSGNDDFQIFSRGESPNYEVFKISRAAGSTELLANQNLTLSADYDANQTSVNSNIIFKTDNAERMRITSGGTIEIRNGSTVGGEIKLTGADNDLTINGARGQIKLQINGTNAYEVDSVQLYPSADNSKNLGTSSLRWSTVYAVNGINTSDETLKENIKECDLGIDFIDSLKPKSYNFKDLKEDNDAYGKKRYGLIAQDILQTELKDSVFGKKDGEYGLSYNDLIAPMIKAIQELKAEIELLKTQINN